LVFSRGVAVHGGNPNAVGVLSFHVVVVGANKPPMLRCLGEGWSKLPSPLDTVRNSSMESSIVVYSGVDAPL
jgi:hypothetical protein